MKFAKKCWTVAALLAGFSLMVMSVEAQAPPPTLTGETFVATKTSGTLDITATCNPSGTSTVEFKSSGIATGPYTGTFTESGTATIGPQTLNPGGGSSAGPLTSFDVVFTISSATAQITGTKVLTLTTLSSTIGQCNTFGTVNGQVELVDVIANAAVSYQAQIQTPNGLFADEGVNPAAFVQRATNLTGTNIGITFLELLETFTSTLSSTVPVTTPGQATGGGQFSPDATFGFTAKSDANGMKGTCTVIDRATDTTVKCLDVTSYAQAGTHVTFLGNARVNGAIAIYKIDVDDFTESGAGSDTFKITAGGYSAGGVLTKGNIQVHK